MPGYDANRFIGLSQSDKSEYTCSICQDIFRCPVVANCCLQTFCEECINDWLKNNNSCPYDRKQLNPNELSRPPRAMMNILGRLQLKCDLHENGCQEIVSIESLTQHIINCKFNPDNLIKCKTCLIKITPEHECVKHLLEINKKSNEENEFLKDKLKVHELKYETLMSELKTANENYFKTIQEMTNLDISWEIDNRKSLTITNMDILEKLKNFHKCPEIVHNNTSKEVTDKIISTVMQEIKNSNDLSSLCENISINLDDEYGISWKCIALYNQIGTGFTRCTSLIVLKFNMIKLHIFQYVPKITGSQIFNEIKKYPRKPNVVEVSTSKEVSDRIISIVMEQMDKTEIWSDFCKNISVNLNDVYGKSWKCIARYNEIGGHYFEYTAGYFIILKLKNLQLIIFRNKLSVNQ